MNSAAWVQDYTAEGLAEGATPEQMRCAVNAIQDHPTYTATEDWPTGPQMQAAAEACA